MSTILCDGSDTDEIIEEFGTNIQIVSIETTYSDDEYHEPIEAETTHIATAVVENVTSEEDRVREGLFQTGDIYVHFKMDDQQYAVINNYIIYAGDKYKIKLIDKEQIGDVVYTTGVGASIYERNIS